MALALSLTAARSSYCAAWTVDIRQPCVIAHGCNTHTLHHCTSCVHSLHAATGCRGPHGLTIAPVQARAAHADSDSPVALNPEEWRSFKLTDKKKVNHDVVSLTFGFDSPKATSGLPTASCLVTRAPLGEKAEDGSDKMVIRPYTPVSRSSEQCAPLPQQWCTAHHGP